VQHVCATFTFLILHAVAAINGITKGLSQGGKRS